MNQLQETLSARVNAFVEDVTKLAIKAAVTALASSTATSAPKVANVAPTPQLPRSLEATLRELLAKWPGSTVSDLAGFVKARNNASLTALTRALVRLRAEGKVTTEGKTRATRYYSV